VNFGTDKGNKMKEEEKERKKRKLKCKYVKTHKATHSKQPTLIKIA
jgi:hypothetical protein